MLARRSIVWIVPALVALVLLAGCAQSQDAGEAGDLGDGPDDLPGELATVPLDEPDADEPIKATREGGSP